MPLQLAPETATTARCCRAAPSSAGAATSPASSAAGRRQEPQLPDHTRGHRRQRRSPRAEGIRARCCRRRSEMLGKELRGASRGPELELWNQFTPVTALGITNATAVSARWRRTCALLSGGTIHAGQQHQALADGTVDVGSRVVTVSGITGASSMTAGYQHSCALLSTAAPSNAGAATTRAAGDGTTTDRPTRSGLGDSNATAATAGGKPHVRLAVRRHHQVLGQQ